MLTTSIATPWANGVLVHNNSGESVFDDDGYEPSDSGDTHINGGDKTIGPEGGMMMDLTPTLAPTTISMIHRGTTSLGLLCSNVSQLGGTSINSPQKNGRRINSRGIGHLKRFRGFA